MKSWSAHPPPYDTVIVSISSVIVATFSLYASAPHRSPASRPGSVNNDAGPPTEDRSA